MPYRRYSRRGGARQGAAKRRRTTKARPRRRAYARKPRMSMVRKVKKLTTQMRNVQRMAEADMGTFTHRKRVVNRLVSAVNLQAFLTTNGISIAFLDAAIAGLRYYDVQAPGTLIAADGSTGTYQREFTFTSIWMRYTVRNNYRVPVHVDVYSCVPKGDTSIAPGAAYTAGLTNAGNPGQNEPLVHLTDSQNFKDLWKIDQHKKRLLQPGQECALYHSVKSFQYDKSVAVQQAEVFQPRMHGQAWVVFIQGVIAHDSVQVAEHGISAAGIDIQLDSTYKLEYPAGSDLHFINIDDASTAFTNDPIVGNKPIAANQTFLQAAGF